ncbi:MAG: AI-2E family transporter, partial [Methanosarcinales archaeon]|nr:AI-2E family transporter [Methanosarcinales archaeon]
MGQDRRFNIVAAFVIVLAFLAAVYITKAFITTILLSIFLAYILHPFYRKLHDITGNKQLSVAIPVLVVLLVFIFIFLGAIGALATELSILLEPGQPLREEIEEFSGQAMSLAHTYLPTLAARYMDRLSELPMAAASWALPALRDWVTSGASSVPVLFTEFTVAVFFTYYMIIDGPGTLKWAL